jgi:hypothetical protein
MFLSYRIKKVEVFEFKLLSRADFLNVLTRCSVKITVRI